MKAEMKRNESPGDSAKIEVIGGSSTEYVGADSNKSKKNKDDEYDDEEADAEDGVNASRYAPSHSFAYIATCLILPLMTLLQVWSQKRNDVLRRNGRR
jgi:hypothetical protein